MFNANNYGYNPYGRYIPQQPIEQPQQFIPQQTNKTVLNGKIVESIDVVKSMDIPLDGSISYYPTADGSAIVSKQLQIDGTSKTIIYKPIENEEKELPKYATVEDLDKAIGKIDLSDIDDLKDEIKDIQKELKDLKKKKKDD